MRRTGVASLPLHYGKAPGWLVGRMCRLAREVITILIDEYGCNEFLSRVSDPFWFQALGCALGYDWHSSGVTTVLTGVLKTAVRPEEHGLAVCGGKGIVSRQTPAEIRNVGQQFGLSDSKIDTLCYMSRMSAKVDNAAIQAGYQLYHHAFFLTEDGKWAVVQQGMCFQDRTARRYHWFSEKVKNLVVEPHSAICGNTKRESALDMTAEESDACRKASVDIAKERPERVMHFMPPANQRQLEPWLPITSLEMPSGSFLSMPRNINWRALRKAYESCPRNYEELLACKGVGPATIRGLALIAELVYGEKPSWKDPVKYSFAYGGKDGVPYPVDREAMDESIQMLRQAIQEAKVGDSEKLRSFERLRKFVPKNMRD